MVYKEELIYSSISTSSSSFDKAFPEPKRENWNKLLYIEDIIFSTYSIHTSDQFVLLDNGILPLILHKHMYHQLDNLVDNIVYHWIVELKINLYNEYNLY